MWYDGSRVNRLSSKKAYSKFLVPKSLVVDSNKVTNSPLSKCFVHSTGVEPITQMTPLRTNTLQHCIGNFARCIVLASVYMRHACMTTAWHVYQRMGVEFDVERAVY